MYSDHFKNCDKMQLVYGLVVSKKQLISLIDDYFAQQSKCRTLYARENELYQWTRECSYENEDDYQSDKAIYESRGYQVECRLEPYYWNMSNTSFLWNVDCVVYQLSGNSDLHASFLSSDKLENPSVLIHEGKTVKQHVKTVVPLTYDDHKTIQVNCASLIRLKRKLHLDHSELRFLAID